MLREFLHFLGFPVGLLLMAAFYLIAPYGAPIFDQPCQDKEDAVIEALAQFRFTPGFVQLGGVDVNNPAECRYEITAHTIVNGASGLEVTRQATTISFGQTAQ